MIRVVRLKALIILLIVAGVWVMVQRGSVIGRSSASTTSASIDVMGYAPVLSDFEAHFYQTWAASRHVQVHYLPPALNSVNNQLELYQLIFKRHEHQPQIVQIDSIWPVLLADDLADLGPYLKEAAAAVPPELIASNTVRGKLVAFPEFVDLGVLYFRPALLARYGFSHPPQTWDELEQMAKVIQAGERGRGHKDFWGYAWQGSNTEALVCNALEWFLSHGGANLIEPDRTVRIDHPRNLQALRRAVGWINHISPPGEGLYQELDAMNLWESGQAAFMRNWASMYSTHKLPVGDDKQRFEIAPLPSGGGGHFGTLGGMSVGVSRYAAAPQLAAEALRQFTSEPIERERVRTTGVIPARSALRAELETMKYTPLQTAVALHAIDGLAVRPSIAAGSSYSLIASRVATVLNRVLLKQSTPEAGLRQLQVEIERLLH